MKRFLPIALALLLAGCGSDDNPAAPAPGAGVPGDFFSLWQTSFVDHAAFFSALDDSAGQFVTMDVDGKTVAGAILRTKGRYIDVGTVRVGQSPPIAVAVDTLARKSVPVYGTPWFLYTSVPNFPVDPPVTFDGVTWHRFRASGSADFAAFEDSIRSVTRPTLSEPAANAVVPRNQDLIVSWSDAGFDPAVEIICYVEMAVLPGGGGSGGGTLAPGLSVPDPDGTTRVTRDVLQTIPPGTAWLTVVRYRERHVTNGSVGVRLKCEGITVRTITLQ